jgi:Zn/Cd-binding protein ZinT
MVLTMNSKDEMLEEYDFSNGICGKYAQAYKEGVNIVKIDNDVIKFFPDAKSVNEALRTLINLMNNGQNPLKLSS